MICSIFAVLFSIAFTACGSQTQSAGQDSGQTGGRQSSDGAQAPGSSPDLYGEVKSVSGNKITLALIEMPQQRFNRDRSQGQPSGSDGNRNSGQYSGNGGTRPSNGADAGNRPEGDGNRPDASGRPSGGGSPRQGGGFSGSGNMPRDYTGESVTLDVPAETPITTFERGGGDTDEKKLTLQDIKEGSLLQVWYKKDSGDKKEVESMRLIQAPASNPEANPVSAPTDVPEASQ